MDSEVQRLRFRVRQLEREVRALRTIRAGHRDDQPISGPVGDPFGGRVGSRFAGPSAAPATGRSNRGAERSPDGKADRT